MSRPLPFERTTDVLYLLLFLLSFAACSKSSDDPGPQPPMGNNCRLDSIGGVLTYAGGASYQTEVFLYDNQERVVTYRFDAFNSQAYRYGSSGKLNDYDIISGAIKKEERVLQYDAQGRIIGYTSTPHPTITTAADALLINYTDALITYTFLKNGDTLSSRLYHYENGNNIRTEYFLQEYLVKIDSSAYGSALAISYPDKEIQFATTGAPASKNLPTRTTTFDVTTGKRSWAENYTYEFASDGKLSTKTIIAQNPDPTLNYRFQKSLSYSCR